MPNRKVPITAVGGVVYRESAPETFELLLIKKQGGFWTLPKGKVESDETPVDAVTREIFEETGITGVVEEVVRQVSYRILKKGKTRRKVVTYYLFCAKGGALRPSEAENIEHLRWLPSDVALRRIRRNRVRAVVRRAMPLLQQHTHYDVQSEDRTLALGDLVRGSDMGTVAVT